jgi:hypothetical protein
MHCIIVIALSAPALHAQVPLCLNTFNAAHNEAQLRLTEEDAGLSLILTGQVGSMQKTKPTLGKTHIVL